MKKVRSVSVYDTVFPQLIHSHLCLQADCTHGNRIYLAKLKFISHHKTQVMASRVSRATAESIENQILIFSAKFPLLWAMGTLKPWILLEFTFAFTYGH